MQLVPVLRTDDDVAQAQLLQLAVQNATERAGFVATVNFLGQGELLFGPAQKLLGGELLRGLRRGVAGLPDDTIAAGMDVDAQLDPLGFDGNLCLRAAVGIGVRFVFHITGAASSGSPANTHVI